VPAYVHIPKGLKGRAPAIVDLHSHGGMFLFGKEKVIDFGRNHPVMTEYHKVNMAAGDGNRFGPPRVCCHHDRRIDVRRTAADDGCGPEIRLGALRYSVEDARRLNAVCASKESTLAKSLTLSGMAWEGIVLRDDMRTVDYLISRRK